MNRCAIYARVSKESSADKNISIPSQIKKAKEYARNFNALIDERYIYIDEGKSAKSDNRPKFLEMITACKSKNPPFNKIICLNTSRFARNREDAIIYKGLLKKQGIDLVFIELPNSHSPIDKIIEGMLEVFDEFHSITSKISGLRGMRENVEQGFRSGGRAPFGYDLQKIAVGINSQGESLFKTKLVINPKEAEAVKAIFEMRAKGAGYGSIVKYLNQNNIEVRSDGRWGKSTIYSILRNHKAYLGHTVWNRHSPKDKDGKSIGGKFRSEDEWVVKENTHPAIITPELALQCQARLKKQNGNRVDIKYLLIQLLSCGKCGKNFSGSSEYYRCVNQMRTTTEGCSNNTIYYKNLDDRIMQAVRRELFTDSNLDNLENFMKDKLDDYKLSFEQNYRDLEAELNEIDLKLGRWYKSIESGQVYEDEIISGKIKDYQQKRDLIQDKIKALKCFKDLDKSKIKINRNGIKDFINKLKSAPEIEDKRFLLQEAIKKIIIFEKCKTEGNYFEIIRDRIEGMNLLQNELNSVKIRAKNVNRNQRIALLYHFPPNLSELLKGIRPQREQTHNRPFNYN